MDNKRLIRYCAIAFGFTWLLAGIGWTMGIDAEAGLAYMALAAACMLGPAISAMVCQRLIDRAPWAGLGVNIAATRWRVLLATCAIGLLLAPLYLLVQHVFGDVLGIASFGHAEVSNSRMVQAIQELAQQLGREVPASGLNALLLDVPGWLVLVIIQVAALLSASSLNLIFMLGEELGWRGYLYQLLAERTALQRVGITGVLWGLWHAPLIAMGHNYPGYPVVGIGMMVVFCLLAAFVFDWTRARSHSVWSSALLHGLINGSAGGTILFAWGGHPLVGSMVGIAGFLVLGAFITAIILFDPRYRAMLRSAQPSA